MSKLDSVTELVAKLTAANEKYRNTDTLDMSDAEYDLLVEQLRSIDPGHPYLSAVEPEADFGVGKVRHSRPMLSTEKSYDDKTLAKWCKRVDAAAKELGLETPVTVSITAKLDGMAGRFEKDVLASRGDGLTGNDLTHMIAKGVQMSGKGDGELVISLDYFEKELSDDFKHPRNVVSGIMTSDTVSERSDKTLKDGELRFVTYDTLPFTVTNTERLVDELDALRKALLDKCIYPVDGIVIKVNSPLIQKEMGSTGHHHNWMIAAKQVHDTAVARVLGITWQVGRTGKVTPVVQITPAALSGAVITNVTGHHAANIVANKIGVGGDLTITRAGLVIPYILNVVTPAAVSLPTECPCCMTTLMMQGPFIYCSSNTCEDVLAAKILHFFSTLGTVDQLGPAACKLLVKAGHEDPVKLFGLSNEDFIGAGFGKGQATNITRNLEAAKGLAVDDFRVLAAFGIEHLGKGDSKKILKKYPLSDVCNLSYADLMGISGFGEITSRSVSTALPSIKDRLKTLTGSYLNNVAVTTRAGMSSDSPVSGKHVVFTGSMTQGTRPDMIKRLETLGGISQSGVNKKTDYLVVGEKVGKSKTDKAKALGTAVLTEAEYLKLIK